MITLQELQASIRLQAIASACPTKAEFISLVNSAAQRYMRRGDFIGTVEDIFVCVTNGCFVTPRYVGAIRRVNLCNRDVQVENGWWRFMRTNEGFRWHQWIGADCGNLQDRGTSPVFQDIMGDGRLIHVYARCQADLGKTMQFFGTDNNGQPLMTKNPDGTWSQGITLTLASPFVSSLTYVRHIDYVIRDQTQCPVDCYAYNVALNVLEELAHYEPTETRPEYKKYQLNAPWPNWGTGVVAGPGCCGVKRGVLLRVKLKFIPAQVPTDILFVSNEDALKKMIMSIKAEESGDIQAAKQWEMDAVKEGNLEINDQIPDEQFAVTNNVLGAHTWNQQCF